MANIRSFVKRPVSVQAIQFDGSNGADVVGFMGGAVTDAGDNFGDLLVVSTLEGTLYAKPGWWIVRGVEGEFHPVRPDIFEQTYEEAH